MLKYESPVIYLHATIIYRHDARVALARLYLRARAREMIKTRATWPHSMRCIERPLFSLLFPAPRHEYIVRAHIAPDPFRVTRPELFGEDESALDALTAILDAEKRGHPLTYKLNNVVLHPHGADPLLIRMVIYADLA